MEEVDCRLRTGHVLVDRDDVNAVLAKGLEHRLHFAVEALSFEKAAVK